MILVLDASVVVKWFGEGDEENSKKSERILELLGQRRVGIVWPDFLLVELANVLHKAKGWSGSQVEAAIKKIGELNVRIVRDDAGLVTDAAYEAQKWGISVYDGMYVALARQERGILVSDNPKHHGKVTDGTVVMLKDLKV